MVYQDGRLYEPEGATPSTHILKPDHPDTESYPASVINEYLTMRLARAAGLPVPDVYMLLCRNRFTSFKGSTGSRSMPRCLAHLADTECATQAPH